MAEPRTVPLYRSTDSVSSLLRALDEMGAAAVADVVSPGLITSINEELEPHLVRAREHRPTKSAEQSVRISGLIGRSHSIIPVILSPIVERICDCFLLPSCACYQLCGTHIVEVSPGDTDGALHRDDVIWPLPGANRPIVVINFLIALTDFTASNGATRVLLGSHRWPRDPSKIGPRRLDLDTVDAPDQAQLALAVMPAGSMVAVLGGTVHGTGANDSLHPRRALSLSFNLGWLRQEENMYLTVPSALVEALPPRLQQLLGYSIHEPYLGHETLD